MLTSPLQDPVETGHWLHSEARAYRETNCYTDVVIELLHARGLDPVAVFGHLVRCDFEGDQFTFFKPPLPDIERLYGIDIHEMQPLHSLVDQAALQLGLGRSMLVEVDSFYLPDTSATAYRSDHVKTTIAMMAIDRQAQSLTYLHNTGRHALSGDDYRGLFRLDDQQTQHLPPYIELARFDAGPPLDGDRLRTAAMDLLRGHLARRPAANPFRQFGDQLALDLPSLLAGDLRDYHDYAFATVRMAGAAFDLLAAHLEWLLGPGATAGPSEIVEQCQILSFRMARRRSFDPSPTMAALITAWDRTIADLDRAVG